MGFLSQTDIPLSLVTLLLAWATIRLAVHTQALSNFTEDVVTIETARQTREQCEKRQKDLDGALEGAKTAQEIDGQRFAQRLATLEDFPAIEVKALETHHAMKRYLDEDDTDCHQHLEVLRRIFDTVRREKSGFRPNETEVAGRIKTLQGRLQWFVDRKSEEISISV
jgi:hypothetical protein